MMSEEDWHQRFIHQARWTGDLRHYLYRNAGLEKARTILEVGCGTGVIISELVEHRELKVHGLDINLQRLKIAKKHAPANYTAADALYLPYREGTFDITLCHFLLLWVKKPDKVLAEMKRVTRPGGAILVMAEPDYSQRVDKPDSLAILGRWQAEALQKQGAATNIGSRLETLFLDAGIQLIETGILRSRETTRPAAEELDMEWRVLEADLQGTVSEQEIGELKRLDAQAWAKGERRLFVPTYFAWGKA